MRRPATDRGGDVAMLAVVGAGLSLCAIVWLWAGIAGVLFGHGWPSAGLGEALEALPRLPTRLSDPATAWPEPARSQLPGAARFYVALALLALALGCVLALARRTLALSTAARNGGASWASRRELGPLVRRRRSPRGPRGDRSGRLVLGRRGSRLLYAEDRHALVAFGPPQSGKSAGLAVPALLEWEGPVVASSIKTDLLSVTLARRRKLGDVFVFDPFGLSGAQGQTWSPLRGADTWDGALEVAWRLASAGELDQRGVEGGDFWAIAAEQRLAPLLYTAARTAGGIESLVRWTYGQGSRELDQALAQVTGEARDERELADAHAAYDAVRAYATQADRTRSSIEATAQALLRAYRFARVARSARTCEITPDGLLDNSATLYLIGDAKASKLLRPIFLALGRPARAPVASVPGRGGERRAPAQPGGDRVDGSEPQHPTRVDLS
jgi:type IV secretion system protein VirD4